MTNTSARRAQDQRIRNFLAWQLMGNPDLSMHDENLKKLLWVAFKTIK